MNKTQKLALVLKSQETLERLVCESNCFQLYMNDMVEVEQGISEDENSMNLETLIDCFQNSFDTITDLLNQSKELLEGVI